MKKIRLYTCLVIIGVAGFVAGCKPKHKPKPPAERTHAQDSILKRYQQRITIGPDAATVRALIADFAPERKAFQVSADKLYPGLLEKYKKETAALMKIDSAKKFKGATDKIMGILKEKYKEKFLKAWKHAGLNDEIIRSKYHKRLGNIPVDIGDFGTGVIRQGLGGDPQKFPSDTTFNVPCPTFEVQEKGSSCGGIAYDNMVFLFPCSVGSSSGSASLVGGCDVWGMLGTKVTVPAPFTQVTETARGSYDLYAFALAVIGGSASTALVGTEISNGNTVLNTVEHARIWAVAPIIWATTVTEAKTAQDMIVGYAKASGTVDKVNMKAYARTGQGTFLFGGSLSNSSFTFTNGIDVEFIQ